ncbi:uncharacterized protein LOC135500622 [Lineus longissimus]|uniref:uncharacterized protein LOC135500622 n=1 Tax=Lineus longissimus TaxID=88925 RepID=UPI002B4D068E
MSEPLAGDVRGRSAIDREDGSTAISAKKSKKSLCEQSQFYCQDEQGSCHGDNFYNEDKQPSREHPACSGQQRHGQENQANTGGEGTSHNGSRVAPNQQDSDQEGHMTSCSHLMKQIGEELNYIHGAFRPLFIDCEIAENMCIDHLDSLLTQAKEYEETLIAQKQQLRGRLSILSQTLKNI